MNPLVSTLVKGALPKIRHVHAVPPEQAHGLVAEVYTGLTREFGILAPPVALHAPDPELLAGAWMLLRETLVAQGRTGRALKEAVATAVSRSNACPYCVEVHQAKVDTLPPGADQEARAVAAWALAAWPGQNGPAPATDPVTAAEIAGVAVTFHYLNRMVSVFLPDSPVPEFAPGPVRGPAMRMVARSIRPARRTAVHPGGALTLLPEATPPAVPPPWAGASPVLGDAFARAAAAVERASAWVPEGVRRTLTDRLAAHDGSPVGPSRAWLDEAAAGVAAPDAPAARLALLTALAPYQVTDADVAAFRADHPADRELIALTAWAALTTALHIGALLPVPPARRAPGPTA